jgi:pSer/pThr/pTyr-binding forkhead associated (FHA) protein
MAKLLIKTEGVANPVLELRLGVNRIGRAEDNHFQIVHSTVSTHHCELVLGDGTVLLRDCNSTNGTFVNGERVKEVALRAGQTIHIGDVELFVETTEVKVEIPQYERPRPAPPVVLDDGAMLCPRHKKSRVTHQCTHCREVMCDKCVHRLRRRGGKTYLFCPLCSNPVELIGGARTKKKSFLGMLKRTIKMPFLRGKSGDE